MEYLLICLLPLSMAAGVFIGIKAVQIGLRWQMQAQAGEKPTLEAPKLQNKQQMSANLNNKILNEWLFGEQKGDKDGN